MPLTLTQLILDKHTIFDLFCENGFLDSLSVTCDRSVVFSGMPVSSTNKTDRHNITEILLKVVLNTINLNQTSKQCCIGVYSIYLSTKEAVLYDECITIKQLYF